MVAITATNSATPSLQSSLSQAKLEQAKREADNAEARAEDLRAQADAAEHDAQQRNQTVRALSARKEVSDSTYPSPAKASSTEVPSATQDFLVRMYSATSAQFAASGNALKNQGAQPVVNTQGQTTGRILNLSA
jgi:type II secretory pathway pseudopilin PulG